MITLTLRDRTEETAVLAALLYPIPVSGSGIKKNKEIDIREFMENYSSRHIDEDKNTPWRRSTGTSLRIYSVLTVLAVAIGSLSHSPLRKNTYFSPS